MHTIQSWGEIMCLFRPDFWRRDLKFDVTGHRFVFIYQFHASEKKIASYTTWLATYVVYKNT